MLGATLDANSLTATHTEDPSDLELHRLEDGREGLPSILLRVS